MSEPTKGPDSPKPEPDSSAAELQKQLDIANAKVADSEKTAKDAFAERDKLREERRIAEDSRKADEDKALEEQGKYKDLYDTASQEKKTLEPFKEKYEALLTEQRNEIIEVLPEAEREAAKDFDLTALKALAKAYGKETKHSKPTGTQPAKPEPENKAYDEMTPKEQEDYVEAHGMAAFKAKVTKDTIAKRQKE